MEILSLRELKKLISLTGLKNSKLLPVPLDPGPGWEASQLQLTSDYGRVIVPMAENIVAVFDQATTFNPFSNLDTGSREVGQDYAVYICMDGNDSDPEIVVSKSFTGPSTGHTYCRLIGYFHNGPDSNQTDGIILPFSVFNDPLAKYKGMVAVGDYSGQNNDHAPFKIDIYRAVSTGESVNMLTGSGVQHSVTKVAPIYGSSALAMRYFDAILSLGLAGKVLPNNMQWTLATLGVSASASITDTNTNGQYPANRSFWGIYDCKTSNLGTGPEQVAEWIMDRYSANPDESSDAGEAYWWQDGDEGVPSGVDTSNGADVHGVRGAADSTESGGTTYSRVPSALLRGYNGQLQGVHVRMMAGESSLFRGIRP